MSNKKASKFSFYIETLGCPKNMADSRQLRTGLRRAGMRESGTPEEADVLILNTCSFIREAQEETIDTAFEFLELKKTKQIQVGMVGCFPERFDKAVKEEIPELDFSFGARSFGTLATDILSQLGIQSETHAGGHILSAGKTQGPWSYFRIARGCSRNCAFCAIPVIRGKLTTFGASEYERQWEEEKFLSPRKIREAILVSQDTISQGMDGLREALDFFSQKEEIRWVRLQYLFPDRRMFDLLSLFDEYPKLVPYLDMPVQHASDSVLQRMNRPGASSLFNEIFSAAIEKNPAMEIRTSLITGFPGETEEEFSALVQFLETNPVHKLALFRYSHEAGTPAGDSLQDDVPENIKIERINFLRNLHLEKRQPIREALRDTTELVMLESFSGDDALARRAVDSPDIDEILFVPKSSLPENLNPGDFFVAELHTPMEYDWLGDYAGPDPLG